jgi:hypothetical protein
MTRLSRISTLAAFLAIHAFHPGALGAQGMDHAAMMAGAGAAQASPPSQAAFATIQDIVRKLKADPSTDWSRVNLEALRAHLIDMDNVVMRAKVKQANVAGGVSLDVTGTGETVGAIRRMLTMHAMALNEDGVWRAQATEIANGVRLVVTAPDPGDAKAVAMARGLGFAGLITEGDHHAMHHLMLARGEPMMHGATP